MGILSKLFGSKPKKQPLSINDQNFHAEVMKSDVPVLIDFWSATCAPCKQLEPIIMNLAADYDGQVKVAECNVATAQKVCARYGVMATPTVLYFKDGEMVERVSGFRGSLYHRDIIDNELLPAEAEA